MHKPIRSHDGFPKRTWEDVIQELGNNGRFYRDVYGPNGPWYELDPQELMQLSAEIGVHPFELLSIAEERMFYRNYAANKEIELENYKKAATKHIEVLDRLVNIVRRAFGYFNVSRDVSEQERQQNLAHLRYLVTSLTQLFYYDLEIAYALNTLVSEFENLASGAQSARAYTL